MRTLFATITRIQLILSRARATRALFFVVAAEKQKHLRVAVNSLESSSALHDAIVCVSQKREMRRGARRRASRKEREKRARKERDEREPKGAYRLCAARQSERATGEEGRGGEREREEDGAGWKLEGRRSRPGLVLADSLALSQRNASNAGEPLRSLSSFRTSRLSFCRFLSRARRVSPSRAS